MNIIGIALTYEYTDISLQKEEFTYRFPTLLSRERRGDRFYIGEEAYKRNLDGGVILVDRLLSLFKKKGTAIRQQSFWGFFWITCFWKGKRGWREEKYRRKKEKPPLCLR